MMLVNVALVTVMLADLDEVTPLNDALIVVDPALAPVTTPAALTVATEVAADVQDTLLVIFAVEPSV